MEQRFTRDGSDALERRLAQICTIAADGVMRIVDAHHHAIVLGGGYGRGEGGVLRTPHGDQPYNDLEIYVFLRGNRVLNDRRFSTALTALGHELSPEAGLHVEFKVESLKRFESAPVTMFSYDLVAGHRLLSGPQNFFSTAQHHLEADKVPLSEATRLLFNRFSGLLLTRELLQKHEFTPDDADFCTRNLAKAELALGDALLAAHGFYHWSCLERNMRLAKLEIEQLDSMADLRRRHSRAAEFKLHPHKGADSHALLQQEMDAVAELGRAVWLWLEGIRMQCAYGSALDYAMCKRTKCADVPAWRNVLLNWRSFGLKGMLSPMAVRYPRERLLKALPLLLWDKAPEAEPARLMHLQRQLGTKSREWSGLVAAYKNIWPAYG